MRAQMDGLQLQVQLVAKKSGDNHVSSTTLEHMAQRLEQGLQGLTARESVNCLGVDRMLKMKLPCLN